MRNIKKQINKIKQILICLVKTLVKKILKGKEHILKLMKMNKKSTRYMSAAIKGE